MCALLGHNVERCNLSSTICSFIATHLLGVSKQLQMVRDVGEILPGSQQHNSTWEGAKEFKHVYKCQRRVPVLACQAATPESLARPCAGIPDLLQLLVELTQTRLGDRLIAINELQCTVLEVKVIEGLGTTMDVVLINGVLREGDVVVVCGLSGPVVTPIRSLLTPHPMKVRTPDCTPAA